MKSGVFANDRSANRASRAHPRIVPSRSRPSARTEAEAAVFGGVAGEQYDVCHHLACDTSDNILLNLLDEFSDAAAHAVLYFAQTTVLSQGFDDLRAVMRGPEAQVFLFPGSGTGASIVSATHNCPLASSLNRCWLPTTNWT